MIATQRQRQGMARFIPTEFLNLDIDDRGFIYCVHADSSWGAQNNVHRLNPMGNNVLRRLHGNPLIGDHLMTWNSTTMIATLNTFTGRSRFVDIKAVEDGKYMILDSNRSRIFTYDSEGNLLYVFGSPGRQLGNIFHAVAIDAFQDSVFVLDKNLGYITEFRETDFGKAINTAIHLRFTGQEAAATDQWRTVLKLCATYELAYDGIGKSLLADRQYAEAMRYFRMSTNTAYYSIAFQQWRLEIMKVYAPPIMTIGVIFIIFIIVIRTKPAKRFIRTKIFRKAPIIEAKDEPTE
jgi:hypothetical protein